MFAKHLKFNYRDFRNIGCALRMYKNTHQNVFDDEMYLLFDKLATLFNEEQMAIIVYNYENQAK